MPRAFLGLPVNPDLAELVHLAQREIPGVRWISPPNLHVTVIFLGSQTTELLAAIARSLHDVPCPRVETTVTGVSVLPSERRPRVLALDLELTRATTHLVDRTRAAVGQHGVEMTTRPFRPHLTVARLKPSTRTHLTTLRDLLQDTLAQPFKCEQLNLYESMTRSTGAEYHVLHAFQLVDA